MCPIYEYLCSSCAHSFERKQSIAENTLIKCPECKRFKLRKVISASNIVLKGSGWENNGYGSR